MSAADGAPRKMRLIAWKPYVKGALRGFVTVELPIGLTIREMPVLIGKNGPWVSLPGKPELDGEGRARRDDKGKIAYVALLQWRDRDLTSRFSKAVVDLLLGEHPRALSESGGS